MTVSFVKNRERAPRNLGISHGHLSRLADFCEHSSVVRQIDIRASNIDVLFQNVTRKPSQMSALG
jgi:hypothetical protein